MDRVFQSFRRLQWKLTLSYTAVTVGSLFVVVLIIGYLLFSRAFIPIEIYNRFLTPEEWIRIITENDAALVQNLLSQKPIDTELIGTLMQMGELTITEINLIQIGDFQLRLRTEGRGGSLILDKDGVLVGTSNPDLVPTTDVGRPLDTGILPGLEETLNAALGGESDPERIFVTLDPHESVYFAVPVMNESSQEVLGAVVIYIEHLPTAEDIPETLILLLGRSILILLLGAAVVGTIFGWMTARGLVVRLGQISQTTDAWSQGDFSEYIEDPGGDEINHLSERLNIMAEQLQQLLTRRQEMAISEERGRLARDLHDSAKQEALAASFHIGTALTLFERDPKQAKSHLIEADNLVDSVRVELTDLIHELRPLSMNGDSFDDTINEYIIEWAHQSGIPATLSVDGFVDLSLEVKQAIYRIMQEALSNIARHSDAENVEIALMYQDHSVEFIVRDDGVGFDPQRQNDGMGLDSMRERTEGMGGEFRIESGSNQGTKITVTFPIE